ncbi:uncharacterized protein LOC135935922 [Cloeon dipterum]|uniref:uncharacterized protein LOC135935922 n=1 Tax=Cloeon dipterum TaxID=197152 RepID=UPI0032204D96
MWKTGDLSRSSYAAKKMIQCLAEHIGLVYSSTKINDRVYLKMISRLNHTIDPKEMQDVLNYFTWYNDVKRQVSARYLILMEGIVSENAEELYVEPFDFAADLINKLDECRGIIITNEETFVFDFLVCLLHAKAVDRFWRFYEFNLEQHSVIPAENDLYSPCLTFENFLKYDASKCIQRTRKT